MVAGGALFSAFALGALAGSLAIASRPPRTGPVTSAGSVSAATTAPASAGPATPATL